MAGGCYVFRFLRRSVDGKHLMHFQSETFVFIVWAGTKTLLFYNSHPFGKGIVAEIYSADTRACRGGLARRSYVHKTKSRLV